MWPTRRAKRGIQQIVARPRHPQTLGKIERFWGTLWRECLEAAVFSDLADARARIGHFIDWYNFRRPHSGIDSLAAARRTLCREREVDSDWPLDHRLESELIRLALQLVLERGGYLYVTRRRLTPHLFRRKCDKIM